MGGVPEPGGTRHLTMAVYALLLLLATGAIGYRVFAPRDTLDPAERAYPAPVVATPELYGATLSAPLVVDGRLRVYAAQREVWADQPVDFRSSLTPFWAYRRWPARLLGVVAVGTTVVTRWSDGYLVALDATRGTVAWRVRGPTVAAGYTGRRTGAATVYAPVGMYTAGSALVVVGDDRTTAYAASSGSPLWSKVSDRCAEKAYFTGPSVFVVVSSCHSPSTVDVDVYDPATGQPRSWPVVGERGLASVTPVACAIGRSECRGVRTPGHAWVIGADGALTAAPTLVEPGTWLVGDVVVAQRPDGSMAGRQLAGGRQLWSWPMWGSLPAGTRIVGVQPGAVHLLTADRHLISVDPGDGRELCRVWLLGDGNTMFDPGYVYATDRYVFVERLRPGAKPSDPDSRYYYPSPNVLVTGT
jgi:outer membrane protein assembly factor BamB